MPIATQSPAPLHRRPGGFTLVEILVVIGLIGLLIALLLPALEKGRESANNVKCANNLREIGQFMIQYANENAGAFPRTVYVAGAAPTLGTGASAANPFGPGGPQPNDVTAAAYLLRHLYAAPAALFTCPYDDVVEYVPDTADPEAQSNFTNTDKNLGYSFANPYPDAAAEASGFQFTNHMSPAFALAADRNPGTGAGHNSRNHEDRGQNVLFADGHVTFESNTRCGVNADEIFVNRNGVVMASPVDATDSVLLPPEK